MTIVSVNRVFRNNFCNCGSGKKTKRCCGVVNEYQYIDNSPEKDNEMAVDKGGEVEENV